MPFRTVAAVAIGCVAPMAVMWFLAPLVRDAAEARGWPVSGWTFAWFGVVPYPTPFTWRAALGLSLIVVPPVVMGATWYVRRYLSARRGAK